MNIVDKLNAVADNIANEGMTIRASEVRAGAIEIRRLQFEIERLLAGWQPIRTKPSFVHCEERGEYCTDDGSLWHFKPTHWRPLVNQQLGGQK